MSSDDQRLQDLFPSISADVYRIFQDRVNEPINHVADAIDSHVSAIADYLREVIVSTSWISESVKASGPIVSSWQAPPPPPPSLLERTQLWISKNRAVSAAVISFLGTGAFLIWWRRRLYCLKRLAKRASGGEKIEVIVLAGTSYSSFASILALDLDRRGFIVYITVGSREEEGAVKSLGSKDIHPLSFDTTTPGSIANSITDFSNRLLSSSSQNILRLSSLILLPSQPTSYQELPIRSIASSAWSRTLNTELLYPFTLAHAFLPILATYANDSQPQQSTWAQNSVPLISQFMSFHSRPAPTLRFTTSLIVLSSSNKSSVFSANNALENVTFASMSAWLTTLRTEYAASGSRLRVVHLRLGAFHHADAACSPKALTIAQRKNSNTESCPPALPSVSYKSHDKASLSWLPTGSPIGELHNGVFDAVVGTTARCGGTLYLGQGSLAYTLLGNLCPSPLIRWMVRSEHSWDKRSESQTGVPDDTGSGSWSQGTAEWEDFAVSEIRAT